MADYQVTNSEYGAVDDYYVWNDYDSLWYGTDSGYTLVHDGSTGWFIGDQDYVIFFAADPTAAKLPNDPTLVWTYNLNYGEETGNSTLVVSEVTAQAGDVIVSNCGNESFNNIWKTNGELNGKAYYFAYWDFYPKIRWTGSQWEFGAGFSVFYYSTDDVATPDLCTTWYVGAAGTAPVPTVTAAGGGAQNLTLSCAAGSYALAGVACTLTYTPAAQNLTLSCGAGSYALTGSACTLSVKRNYTLACNAGSYALTGSAVSFEVKRNYVLAVTQTTPDVVASGAGTTVVNGLYKYFNYGKYFKNDASALVFPFVYGEWYVGGINGGVYYSAIKAVDTPDLVDNWQVETDGTAPVPTFTVSPDVGGAFYLMQGVGSTLTVQRNYTLACNAGSYALTGSAVSFEVKRNYVLSCSAGSLTLTGTAVTLSVIHTYSLSCGAGSYAITGTNAALTSARSLACNSGAYVLTGLEADLFKRLVMPCGNGSYVLTGSDCTLVRTDNPSSIINHVMHYRRLMSR